MDKRKKFFTAGIIFFGLAIIFAVIFAWTIDVTTTAYYIRINNVWVLEDFDELKENFQAVWAIFSILSALAAAGFSILGLWTPEDKASIDN